VEEGSILGSVTGIPGIGRNLTGRFVSNAWRGYEAATGSDEAVATYDTKVVAEEDAEAATRGDTWDMHFKGLWE
jgi:hypothetical protein